MNRSGQVFIFQLYLAIDAATTSLHSPKSLVISWNMVSHFHAWYSRCISDLFPGCPPIFLWRIYIIWINAYLAHIIAVRDFKQLYWLHSRWKCWSRGLLDISYFFYLEHKVFFIQLNLFLTSIQVIYDKLGGNFSYV